MIPIRTTKIAITIRCKYFYHTITKFTNRYIKCATSKIIYCYYFIFLIFSQCRIKNCCGWFIDNTKNFKSCKFTSKFSCLSLCIIKICWTCNYCFINFITNIIFCHFFHITNNHRTKLFSRIFFIINFNIRFIVFVDNIIRYYFLQLLYINIIIVCTNKSLDKINSILWIHNHSSLSLVTNFNFIFINLNNRWNSSRSIRICYNSGFVCLVNSYF